MFGGRSEEPLQAPAQIGGLADVGRGLGIVGAEDKDGRSGGDGSEEFGIAGGNELQTVGEHEGILSGFYGGTGETLQAPDVNGRFLLRSRRVKRGSE